MNVSGWQPKIQVVSERPLEGPRSRAKYRRLHEIVKFKQFGHNGEISNSLNHYDLLHDFNCKRHGPHNVSFPLLVTNGPFEETSRPL